MPIYEYRCDACGAELEKLQKISDPPARECPECGKDALVKRVSASSFRLKGAGWYETDFKTGRKKHGVADDTSGAGQSGAAETSSDTAAKTDNKAADKPAGSGTSTA
ncbi:MAG TPA: zinc ribbon domain-containing protein [Pseudomonadaceae bacterium]|nr:zinc ribbon domain-containing protein [Pseudomonadaceae bacterium]